MTLLTVVFLDQYGDKEMYWISFETISEPYAFSRYFPGIIGGAASDFQHKQAAVLPSESRFSVLRKSQVMKSNNMGLCGRLLHFDDSGTPLWSNGGYLTKEEDWKSTEPLGNYPLNPVWFVDGGDWFTEGFAPQVELGWLERLWSLIAPFYPVSKTFAEWTSIKKSLHVNQNWVHDPEMGVMCLVPNARGIQPVPEEIVTLACGTIERYFIDELGGGYKYSNYF